PGSWPTTRRAVWRPAATARRARTVRRAVRLRRPAASVTRSSLAVPVALVAVSLHRRAEAAVARALPRTVATPPVERGARVAQRTAATVRPAALRVQRAPARRATTTAAAVLAARAWRSATTPAVLV